MRFKKTLVGFMAALMVVSAVGGAMAETVNPFMDVPQGHWAYDAVASLAAKGLVGGYTDGSYKGGQEATRYEMASVVARAIAKIDLDKADRKDVETLKKLMIEFKDELDALGVKFDKLDKRVAVLEDKLGGWKLNGTFKFDVTKTGEGSGYTAGDQQWEMSKENLDIYLSKTINETTSFNSRFRFGSYGTQDGRGNLGRVAIDRVYVDTKLGKAFDLRVGRFGMDFEGDKGLVWNYDANPIFGRVNADGFMAKKNWGNFGANLSVTRNWANEAGDQSYAGNTPFDGQAAVAQQALNNKGADHNSMGYTLDLNYKNEKWFLGATGYYVDGDANFAKAMDMQLGLVNLYAGYNFTPAVALKGNYYWQHAKANEMSYNSAAWKAILDVKQDALKFTSLWLQYGQIGNDFMFLNSQNSMDWSHGRSITDWMPNNDNKSKIWMVGLTQKWNDRWSSFEKYAQADFGTDGLDNAKNFTLGVNYQMNPALAFQLAYDDIRCGDDKDNAIKLRTTVNF